MLFGIHGYFFSVSPSLPLWPCSAALAICAKANREQRDGRRAVAVGEERKCGGESGKEKGRISERMKEGLLTCEI